jgi:predicted kinase
MIVIVFGLPGSGKSYFSRRLAQMLKAKYISSERVRKGMFATPVPFFEDKATVYDEMLRHTIEWAEHGKAVVLNATFYLNDLRQKFMDGSPLLTDVYWIEVIAGESLTKERLAQSEEEDGDVNFDLYQIIKSKWQPLDGDHLTLQSTNSNLTEMLEQTVDYLFSDNNGI